MWEYKTKYLNAFFLTNSKEEKIINDMALDGWRLIAVTCHGTTAYYFERRKG